MLQQFHLLNVVHINTSASEIMKLGTNVSGTNDGIFVNNNNFYRWSVQTGMRLILFFMMVMVM